MPFPETLPLRPQRRRYSDYGFRDGISMSVELDFLRARPPGFLGRFREALEVRNLRHALLHAEAARDPVARTQALEMSAALEERRIERMRYGIEQAARLRRIRERRNRRKLRRAAERRRRRSGV